jgi:hypothetical protein
MPRLHEHNDSHPLQKQQKKKKQSQNTNTNQSIEEMKITFPKADECLQRSGDVLQS